MKKSLFITFFNLISCCLVFAQAPEKLSYQAVIRDANNTLIQNQQVGIRISILQSSVNGTEVFAETHTTSTNDNGLVSIEIGAGTVLSGSLQSIDWGGNEHFIRTQTDPNGGINYSIDGSSQLLTVPYAFYADSAGSSFSGDYLDLVNTPGNLSDFTNDQGFIANELDGDPSNELQVLTISNDTLFLSNGGFAVLPASFDGQYSSLTGAPTNVSAFNNDVGYIINELDGDSTNELQALSISNDTLMLTNGGFVVLPASFDGQYSSLTGTPTNVSSFNNDAGYIINELDGDSTNELQTISISNDSISLSRGNSVALPNDNWLSNGSDIYYNQGNVGVGTSSPSQRFHVVTPGGGEVLFEDGQVTSSSLIRFLNNTGTEDFTINMSNFVDGQPTANFGWAAGNGPNRHINFRSNGSNLMVIKGNGNVGIGTTTPCSTCKLEVHGNLHLKGAGDFVAWSPDETSTKAVMFADNGGVRMGAQGGRLRFVANSALTNHVRMEISTTGNVGIATTPQHRFHVNVDSGDDGVYVDYQGSERAKLGVNAGQEGNLVLTNTSGGSDINLKAGNNDSYLNGGNVGIGLTDPCSTCKLEVNGNITTRDGGDFTAWSPDGTSSQTFLLAADGSGRVGVKGGPLVFTTNSNVSSSSSSSERARITTSGQLGIGTGSSVSSDNNVLLHVKNPSATNTGILIESGNGNEWQMYAHTNDHWGIYEVDAAATRLIVDNGGNVGIATLAPTASLSVNGSANKPGGGSWAVFSDRRLKKNIRPYQDGLSSILKINPVTFQYNGVGGIADTEKEYVGIIAQEIQEVAPNTVRTVQTEEGDYLEFDPSSLDFMMINAIQELNEKLEEMEEKIELLEKENAKLKRN